MSNPHINPSDNSGADRNLNNYVAKQVVKQALLLYPETSPNDNELIKAPVTREAESLLVSSTKASAPESDEAPPLPRQYAGEAQLMAAILEWQRNLRKELEADNLATERPPAGGDSDYVAKLVVAQAVGLQPEPSQKEDEQVEATGTMLGLDAEPLLVSSTAAPAPEQEEASLPLGSPPPRQLPEPTLPLPPGVTRGLPTHTSQDFRHMPRHVWLVRDVFHGGEIIILWGESQAGKTVLRLEMGAASASGADWAGHPVAQTNVVYVALEGQIGVRKGSRDRCYAIKNADARKQCMASIR
jgi:hypothetical protein